MYQLHTEKQRLYFNEVIRLHYEEGMGEDRISRVMRKRKVKLEAQPQIEQDKALKKRVKELEARLLQAEIKAEAYDEMIKIAEARYRIPIRKKTGAKQ